MSDLRGSENYVWSTSCILGSGATANVYQGINKTNGEPVAVKNFHISSQSFHLREFEVLRKIKHENIVQFLAIEDELQRGSKVIVMELCTGGSLIDCLKDPENFYGLEEKGFLLVLDHLCAGMKYLRDNNLIHRDLKPGNIMKFIREDQTTVYKLTDFGAARELADDQYYHSFYYGTEEYLRPDVYKRAILREPIDTNFDATVDLWSIGVTLYQTATGNLPFQPFGGRKNKALMHRITSEKESGVLSGTQKRVNGPIKWNRELPSSCLLSDGLTKIITPLLAGLLESDLTKTWNFERFFKEVDAVLSRKIIDVFVVNEARLIKIYISPDETYQHLQNHIMQQTGIESLNQILLYGTKLFTNLVQVDTKACDYPTTTEENPLILFDKENSRVVIAPVKKLPTWTNFTVLENDVIQAKFACTIGYQCKRLIEKYSLYCKLILYSVENYTRFINNELEQLNQQRRHLLDKAAIFKQMTDILKLSQQNTNYKPQGNCAEKIDDIHKHLVKTGEEVTALYTPYCTENILKAQWNCMEKDLKLPFKTLAPARAKTRVKNLRNFWQHLARNQLTIHSPASAKQFYALKRTAINENVSKLNMLLEEEVFPQYEDLIKNFMVWHAKAQKIHPKTNKLSTDSEKYDTYLRDFEKELIIKKAEFAKHINNNARKKDDVKKVQNAQIKQLLKDHTKNSKFFEEVLLENYRLMSGSDTKHLENIIEDIKNESFSMNFLKM